MTRKKIWTTKVKITVNFTTDGMTSDFTVFRTGVPALLWFEKLLNLSQSPYYEQIVDEEVELSKRDDTGYGDEESKEGDSINHE